MSLTGRVSHAASNGLPASSVLRKDAAVLPHHLAARSFSAASAEAAAEPAPAASGHVSMEVKDGVAIIRLDSPNVKVGIKKILHSVHHTLL